MLNPFFQVDLIARASVAALQVKTFAAVLRRQHELVHAASDKLFNAVHELRPEVLAATLREHRHAAELGLTVGLIQQTASHRHVLVRLGVMAKEVDGGRLVVVGVLRFHGFAESLLVDEHAATQCHDLLHLGGGRRGGHDQRHLLVVAD
ncbi:hypothetical protein ON010_g4230 [Phytophthora cinnamomi]|nr:hypothetical protein ON010_g4230 [Phytophthora cinnamomi]